MDLGACIKLIPSNGGRQNGAFLQKIASEAPRGTAIIELGTWLGAGTAQLALGLLGRNYPPVIHCFDQWQASRSEARLAVERTGLVLQPGRDTLPIVKQLLEPFGASIEYHKGRIESAIWNGPPISVHVDDAAKAPDVFLHALKTFGPYWIPGRTVVLLMDFLFHARHPKAESKCQVDFIAAHAHCFTPIEHEFVGSARAFRYERQIDFAALAPFARQGNLRSLTPAWLRKAGRGLYRRAA